MCAVDTKTSAPHCTCRDGYVRDPDYGCVDENPPLLRLRPDPVHGLDPVTGITHLSQGDRYEEYGVDVIDDNAEEYLRSLKITYSRPLPQGCLLEMGAFTVNYTVATPWTVPNFARTTRTVVIDNVDECEVSGGALGASCPELVAMCDYDAGASCRDEIGTYTCVCPVGTEGDGYRPIPRLRPDGKGGYAGGTMVPRGYAGGTGCRDTSEPVIEILGPNPKRFRVARASGIRGIIREGVNDEGSNARVEAMIAEQRSAYESDIRVSIFVRLIRFLCICVLNIKLLHHNHRPSSKPPPVPSSAPPDLIRMFARRTASMPRIIPTRAKWTLPLAFPWAIPYRKLALARGWTSGRSRTTSQTMQVTRPRPYGVTSSLRKWTLKTSNGWPCKTK